MKILLTGGGTLGSVNPLIAIYEEAREQDKNWEWFWVGTKSGVERKIITSMGISYEWLPSAKLRRYFSFQLLVEPFLFIASFFRSLLIISTTKPDVVVGAGSFISVPVIWASWIFRKKIIIHQQDIRPTLSNKLTSWCSTKITTSFGKSLEDYPKDKTKWIGNPVRDALLSGNDGIAKEKFDLNPDYKTLLVTGGSSGAKALNEWVWDNLGQLTDRINLIHLTGKDKSKPENKSDNYHQVEFLGGDMLHALKASDLVITRAGISTITELVYLSKAAIIIPMPESHQEDNAYYVAAQHAAIVYRQDKVDERMVKKAVQLLRSEEERTVLSNRMHELMKPGSRESMIKIIESL
jgi:UDP-N-acetylglucosamine--N-acetylmuramyl-(pentapeptide) pyrophosphoryl-undecaprenol N-acetylglucosamine transferase